MVKANDFISLENRSFKKKEVTLKDINGKTFTINIDETFKRTDLVKIMTDICERAEYCKKNDITFDYTVCLYAMILKYFTDIKFTEYKNIKDKYENEIKLIRALINLELLEQIMNSISPDEMIKFTDIAKEFAMFTKYSFQVQADQMLDNLINEYELNNAETDDINENDAQENDIQEVIDGEK